MEYGKARGLKSSFQTIYKKFKDEATYTQTTKNMLIMAQIGKSSMLGLVDKFQQKLQEKHPECTPVVMPIIQELAESYSKEIVGEMLCNISVDDRERLYRLITPTWQYCFARYIC